jgi:phosphopantothenoylcysteine decarboxylase/phosphopantothenate--cysteine ligase
MGAAVAAAALDRGAQVTVVAANVEVPLPDGADVVRVESTADLRAALLRLTHRPDGAAGFDALVMAAAVGDFRPAKAADRKLQRGAGLTLELEPTPDVLAQIARIVRGTDSNGDPTAQAVVARPYLVGFAAETGSLDRALDKLRRKGVDLLVANDVAEAGSGFGTETNRVSILAADGGRDDLPLLSKRDVADRLLDRVARALDDRDADAQTGKR